MQTRVIELPRWHDNSHLEEPYATILRQMANHRPRARYTIMVHGSALWGDRTMLRNGLPVSDIDILVVGRCLDDLFCAAELLQPLALSLSRWGMPTFKLGAKFRTVEEITGDQITANELGALINGSALCGETMFEIASPECTWYRSQAELSLSTRIVYTASQGKQTAHSLYRTALQRYHASRLILEISTIALLLVGMLGKSYSSRIRLMSTAYSDVTASLTKDILGALRKALNAKRDPEDRSCYNLVAASALLYKGARQLGVEHTPELTTNEFWLFRRPLDIRDRELWPIGQPVLE